MLMCSAMKPLKIVLAIAGALGILGVFLPYVSAEGISMSAWDVHKMPAGNSGLLNGPNQVYIILACFAVVLLMGVLAFASKLARWQGIVGLVFSLLAFGPELVRKGLTGDEGVSTAIGGKLLFVAAIVGLLAGIGATIKPEA